MRIDDGTPDRFKRSKRKKTETQSHLQTYILTDKQGTKVTTEWMLNTFY